MLQNKSCYRNAYRLPREGFVVNRIERTTPLIADGAATPPVGRRFRAALKAITPARVVAALLLVCAAKGIWFSSGIVVPPDADTVRDLGFIQAVRDGNWFGDPSMAGAWRWYPPLLHDVAALATALLPWPLFDVWLHAGAVLNLLTPLCFYWMNRRLIGAWPAAAATLVLILFHGALLPSDASVGYTPWTLTPALAWPLFFVSVRLVAAAVTDLRPAGAVIAGSATGVVFLAHTVPAVLLAGITALTAVALHGLRWRTLAWLAAASLVALAWAARFLLPLVIAYRLHIANVAPGAWVHPVLTAPLTLLPTLTGGLALCWLVRAGLWSRLPPAPRAILGTWIVLCLLGLGRHYACAERTGGACGVFVVAAHHYLAYLQPAWASVTGLALVRLWRPNRPFLCGSLAAAATFAAAIAWFSDPTDAELRRLGSTQVDRVLDRSAYDWILANTAPADLFVTELPPNPADMGPGAATVIAAGRRLVAPPALHSNPYLDWPSRNERRLAALRPGADVCPLLHEAGGAAAFLMLPRGRTVEAAMPAFSSGSNTIYRVPPTVCPLR